MMQSFGNWWDAPVMVGLGAIGIILIAVLAIAIIVLKGYALWHAAKRDEMWWFIAILVLNTMGILELIYIIFIAKKWNLGGKSGTMVANESPDNNGPKTN